MQTRLGHRIAACLLLLLLTAGAANAAEGIKWVKTFTFAQQQAQKTHQLIMVDFYTEW